jgi:hypothetical protein
MRQHAPFPITESLRVHFCDGLDELIGPLSDTQPVDFERLRCLLEALPLDTADFGLALNRLANARHYVECGEHGAARYELRLLRRSLIQ